MQRKLAEYAKFVVALLGAVSSVVALGVLPDAWVPYVGTGSAVVAAILVGLVPNALTEEQVAAYIRKNPTPPAS